jgi:hypothetical protein
MRAACLTLGLVLVALFVLAGAVAHATPYWGPVEIARWEAEQTQTGATPPVTPDESWMRLGELAGERTDYLAVFSRIAHFLQVMQVTDPLDPQFGGIREGEHMLTTIQTDNTSESIWVWSRYYELTGDNQYHQNLMNSWTYESHNPAYLEEGDSTPTAGYYRMYNCGWATRAEIKYRDVYGDEAYHAYGDSCASYIRYHTLIRPGSGFNQYVNPPVLSWAVGNLYWAGVRGNRVDWRQNALQQGATVKGWVEGEPVLLANETWAMSGGATMWGLLNSYFSGNPGQMPAWLTTYKSYMDTTATPGSFTNAWNGWYALGHRAVGEALGSAYHLGIHLRRTEGLIAEDGDLDGGIPARLEDTDQMDQTWVSNYLAFMGCDPLLPTAGSAPEVFAGGPGLALTGVPNPSSDAMRLTFELPRAGEISLAIYDCAGRLVTRLAAGAAGAGPHAIDWRGLDRSGRAVAAGSYRAVLRTAQGKTSRAVLWVR